VLHSDGLQKAYLNANILPIALVAKNEPKTRHANALKFTGILNQPVWWHYMCLFMMPDNAWDGSSIRIAPGPTNNQVGPRDNPEVKAAKKKIKELTAEAKRLQAKADEERAAAKRLQDAKDDEASQLEEHIKKV
jgi:hypothetical protein